MTTPPEKPVRSGLAIRKRPLGIEDPALAAGTDLEKEAAFVTAFKYMKNRVSLFLALPLESLDHLAVTAHLHDIGKQDGATAKAGGHGE